MTRKQDKVTDAGAVALEESQLDDAQGGIIAVAPADTTVQKVAGITVTEKYADGSVKPAIRR